MNIQRMRSPRQRCGAYMLVEALVYIGLVVVVLGTGFAVMYRCVDNCIVLRRNAEDVTAALRAGERWRADVRNSRGPVRVENAGGASVLLLSGAKGEVRYRFEDTTVTRQAGLGTWVKVLDNVNSSSMEADSRKNVTAWRWEVELLPRIKGYNKPGRVRPLFTFTAVPERSAGQ